MSGKLRPVMKPRTEDEIEQLKKQIEELTKKLEEDKNEDAYECDICHQGKVSHLHGDNYCPKCGAIVEWK